MRVLLQTATRVNSIFGGTRHGRGVGEAWSSFLPEDAYAELTRIRLQINVVQFT